MIKGPEGSAKNKGRRDRKLDDIPSHIIIAGIFPNSDNRRSDGTRQG
jgi:hypothetical protein